MEVCIGRDGGLSVITIGQQVVVRWCADSWAIVQKVSYCILNSLCSVVVTNTSLLGVIQYWNAYYGQRTGAILLDRVVCSLSESRLLDCIYTNETSDCRHSYDAGLSCQPCKN